MQVFHLFAPCVLDWSEFKCKMINILEMIPRFKNKLYYLFYMWPQLKGDNFAIYKMNIADLSMQIWAKTKMYKTTMFDQTSNIERQCLSKTIQAKPNLSETKCLTLAILDKESDSNKSKTKRPRKNHVILRQALVHLQANT